MRRSQPLPVPKLGEIILRSDNPDGLYGASPVPEQPDTGYPYMQGETQFLKRLNVISRDGWQPRRCIHGNMTARSAMPCLECAAGLPLESSIYDISDMD